MMEGHRVTAHAPQESGRSNLKDYERQGVANLLRLPFQEGSLGVARRGSDRIGARTSRSGSRCSLQPSGLQRKKGKTKYTLPRCTAQTLLSLCHRPGLAKRAKASGAKAAEGGILERHPRALGAASRDVRAQSSGCAARAAGREGGKGALFEAGEARGAGVLRRGRPRDELRLRLCRSPRRL